MGLGYTATAVQDPLRTCSTAGEATSCVVTGLTNGQQYSFTVTASNSVGPSAASTASPTTTPQLFTGSPTKPEAPTGVTARAGDSRAVVSWNRPLDPADLNGVRQTLSYDVTAAPQVGGQTETCQTTGATSCVVSGLANGTSYKFTVVARNLTQSSSTSAPMAQGVTPWPYVNAQGPLPGAEPPSAPSRGSEDRSWS